MDQPPLRVYGSEISYYTGKLEAYLRYKEIPYERPPMSAGFFRKVVRQNTGAAQMPAVELPDGRWMTDTTPMIEWLESCYPEPSVIPRDPLQGFTSRLVEDYADEWMWRPAMHYRWSFRPDAQLLSRRIADELLGDIPLPGMLKRFAMRQRQRRGFVTGDGVAPETRAHVEGTYLTALRHLEAILQIRPFLLGDRPTLVDFGFFASMFRHFGLDPTPSTLMRARAPGVYAWLARVWNARASRTQGVILGEVPSDWAPLLEEIGSAYLPYLCANAEAHAEGRRRFDFEVQGARYRNVPTSRYRVWCMERLREHFAALPEPVASEAHALLDKYGCWEPLWRAPEVASGHDPERRAPFGPGLEVYRAH